MAQRGCHENTYDINTSHSSLQGVLCLDTMAQPSNWTCCQTGKLIGQYPRTRIPPILFVLRDTEFHFPRPNKCMCCMLVTHRAKSLPSSKSPDGSWGSKIPCVETTWGMVQGLGPRFCIPSPEAIGFHGFGLCTLRSSNDFASYGLPMKPTV